MEPIVIRRRAKRKALIRDFLRLHGRRTARNRIGIRRPCNAGQNGLLDQIQTALVIAVQCGVNLVGGVAHVRPTFAVGAIHERVAHADGNRVETFLPNLIQCRIIRRKRPDPFSVITGQPVPQCLERYAGFRFDIQCGACAPRIVFIALQAVLGDIGVLEVRCVLSIRIGIGIEGQRLSGRCVQLDIPDKLAVARKLQRKRGIFGERLVKIIGCI